MCPYRHLSSWFLYCQRVSQTTSVTVSRKLKILIQIFQNKTLVLIVQFAWDQLENIFQIQLFLRIIARNIFLVQGKDSFLFTQHFTQIIRFQINDTPFAVANSSKSKGYISSTSMYPTGTERISFKSTPRSEPLSTYRKLPSSTRDLIAVTISLHSWTSSKKSGFGRESAGHPPPYRIVDDTIRL